MNDPSRILRKKLSRLGLLEFLILSGLFIAFLLSLWIVGNYFDVNNLALAIFLLFMVVIFIRDFECVVELSWSIAIFGINILGVYICEESKIYLAEQYTYSGYNNTLIPLLIAYTVFFSTIEVFRIKNRIKTESFKNKLVHNQFIISEDKSLATFITAFGILAITLLFMQVAKTPYFSLGLTRLEFAQYEMAIWERSLKSYLPLFIPVAMVSGRRGHKTTCLIYIFSLVIYYFWTGDKFGTYFFLGYIILLSRLVYFERKQIKVAFISVILLFISLLGLIYIQRILLYDDNYNRYLEYLFQRVSNQGGVWWKICSSFGSTFPKIFEFKEELQGILPWASTDQYTLGQWKMMLISGDYSSYVQYRIAIKNPYTSTTTASLLYYFGYVGVMSFYVIAGATYSKLIDAAKETFSAARTLESMLIVKIIIHFHALLNSSDMYIISYKGLVYILTLYIIIRIRNSNKRLVLMDYRLT